MKHHTWKYLKTVPPLIQARIDAAVTEREREEQTLKKAIKEVLDGNSNK